MKQSSASHPRKGLLFCAFMLLAFNLRCHITSIPPVIGEIQKSFNLSTTSAGLLTSIPVLCFALLTPFASKLIGSMTIIKACIFSLLGICLGLLIRSIPLLECTFLGTIILGFSVTIDNILSLMIIAHYFPTQKDMMTGFYVAAMSVGSMSTSAFTAVISKYSNWQFGTSIWVVIALCSLLLWFLFSLSEEKTGVHGIKPDLTAPESQRAHQSLWQRLPVVLLSIAFAAHTSMFYGLTAWLPSYLKSSLAMDSVQAGVASSLIQICGILGSFGVPLLASWKGFNRRNQFLLVTTAWFLTPTGLILAPKLWVLWSIMGGIGSGGGFIAVFGLVMDQAIDLDDNRKLSAFVQAFGYAFAAITPVCLGFLKQVFDSWPLGFGVLSIFAIIMTICGMWAASLNEPRKDTLKLKQGL